MNIFGVSIYETTVFDVVLCLFLLKNGLFLKNIGEYDKTNRVVENRISSMLTLV